MKFDITRDGNQLTVAVEGKLDAETSPELADALLPKLQETDDLLFDFAELTYISSAGLRILMASLKRVMRQGTARIANAGGSVLEVLDISGFADLYELV